MSDAAYKRWVNTEWWFEGYERLWQTKARAPQSITVADPSIKGIKGNLGETVTPEMEPSGIEAQTAVQQNVIYLTADSEEELTELKPEEIYIIGGICDHNRYKVASLPS
jgi:tRNA (guanine9-N1)-methyltransferase